MRNMRYPYLTTVIGVALAAISAIFSIARGQLPSAGGPGERYIGNMTAGNMTAVPNMNPSAFNPGGMNASPFGLMNNLLLVAVVIAIVGLAWLGLAMTRSQKRPTAQRVSDAGPYN
jgi:protein-S-isoprenylcysteine O-methyltransferase Ste14